MKTFYAKVSEEAKIGYDPKTGENEPVYLKLVDAPDITDEDEIKTMIYELTAVEVDFIQLITEEEYLANVDEEASGCCGGCSNCSCDEEDHNCGGGCGCK